MTDQTANTFVAAEEPETAADIMKRRMMESVENSFANPHYTVNFNRLTELVESDYYEATAEQLLEAKNLVSNLKSHFEDFLGARGFGSPMQRFLSTAAEWVEYGFEYKIKRLAYDRKKQAES